jgi:tetratricopeptide (TPR) repeat protein
MAGNEEHFTQAMNQGHSAAWDQNWSEAARFYQQALKEFPENPKALVSLALALYELQDYAAALQFYRQAAQISPDDPLPAEKMAEIYERQGEIKLAVKAYMGVAEQHARLRNVEKAILNWQRVVGLDTTNLTAHSRLALVYEKLGRQKQAVAEYILVASLLQNGGEVQKAIQALQHALQFSAESNEAQQALSMVQSGRLLPRPRQTRGVTSPLTTPAALPAAQKLESVPIEASVQQDPIQEARQKALSLLAGLLFESSSAEEPPQKGTGGHAGLQALVRGATGLLGGTHLDHTRMVLHLSQAIDLQSRGTQNNQAIIELEKAIDAGLDHPAANFALALLYASEERLESATRQLQRSINHENFALGSRLLLGQTYQKMHRTKDASLAYLEALRFADAMCVPASQSESIHQLYEPIIDGFSAQEDPTVQERLCENIKELLHHADWRDRIARTRQQLPSPDQSTPIPLAEMLTVSSSSEVVDSLARVNRLARQGRIRSAMEEAFYAITFAPTYLPLHISIGELLLQENRVQDAVTKFTIIAHDYSVRGEAARAVGLYHRVLELSPMDVDARNQLIELLIARGQTEQAINEFIRLADLYYSMADLQNARTSYARALRFAQQASADRAAKIRILHRLADIELQSLDWRSALRAFEQIRNLDPADEKARDALLETNLRLNQLPQAMAELDNYLEHLDETGQRQKAYQYVNRWIEENPTQAGFQRRLAELYRQDGNSNEALQILDKAGEMLIEAGDRPGAAEIIMAILALNPPNAFDYQRLLTDLKTDH